MLRGTSGPAVRGGCAGGALARGPLPLAGGRWVLWVVELALAIPASAAAPVMWAPFPQFAVHAASEDCDEVATSGARLCVRNGGIEAPCYVLPPHRLGSTTYQFAMEPHAERVPLAAGDSWVLFSATYSGCGRGRLTRLSMLRYQSAGETGKMFELLPYVAVTNTDQWARWIEPPVSAYPIIVVANAIGAAGEPRFAAHRYTIAVWLFDPAAGRYGKAVKYVTAQRYDGGDQGRARVIEPERPEILRRLAARLRTHLQNVAEAFRAGRSRRVSTE
jgi:hypothetical protein